MKKLELLSLVLLVGLLFISSVNAKPLEENVGSGECILCGIVVGFVETLVSSNATEQEILNEVDTELCPRLEQYFPDNVCTGFVNLYGPYIIHVVVTEQNSTVVCQELKLCQPLPPTRLKQARFETGDDIGYFWQLTDLHVDIQYKVGSDPTQRCIAGEGDAGPLGSYPCDIPAPVLQAALAFMKSSTFPEPDFLIWTGDSSPHYLSYGSVEKYTPEMVLDNLNRTTRWILEAFPDTTVYAVTGNHDNYLSDQLAPPPEGSKWTSQIASMWKQWLPGETFETFSYAGYFTVEVTKGLRIIGVNTVFCDLLNSWIIVDENFDAAGQFQWMVNTLTQSRADGEKVWVIGHRPPGFAESAEVPNMFPNCNQNYSDIFTQFSDVITNVFMAHEHTDSYRMFLKSDGTPSLFSFLGSALTTFYGLNPTLRMYTYNKTSFEVLNYHQYVANLTQGNIDNNLQFHLSYDLLSEYQLPSVNAWTMWGLAKVMETSSSYMDRYYYHFNNENGGSSCTGSCRKNILCSVEYVDISSFESCDL